MKKVLIINGPNLNLIGTRETEIYGNISFDEIKNECIKKGKENNIEIDFRQTNSEGEIINWIHEVNNNYEGLIINPAGYTHTSIAILDSLKVLKKPKIEIHISNIYSRDEYRKKSVTSESVDGLICGFGKDSYILAILAIKKLMENIK